MWIYYLRSAALTRCMPAYCGAGAAGRSRRVPGGVAESGVDFAPFLWHNIGNSSPPRLLCGAPGGDLSFFKSMNPRRAAELERHIDSLIRRGMKIPDRESALEFALHTGADVLREYLPPFQKPGGEEFFAGAQFDDVVNLFAFDGELRMLVMAAAGRVEMSAHAQMALRGALPEPQAEHKAKNITMGDLSRHYRNLSAAARQDIANVYAMEEKVFERYLHHLTIVRNFCAHHRRLWNWRFHVYLALPAKKPAMLAPFFNRNERGKIYNTLVMLVYMTDIIPPRIDLRRRLSVLLEGRGEADEAAMGFPRGWRTMEFWRR